MSTHETPTREREVIDNYRKALRAVLADKDLPEIDRGIQYLHDLVVITVKNLRPSPARQNMLERIVRLGFDMVKAAEQGRDRTPPPVRPDGLPSEEEFENGMPKRATQYHCGNLHEFQGGIRTCSRVIGHSGMHVSHGDDNKPEYQWVQDD